MRTVILEDWLGDEFGREFTMQVATVGEALRLLCANFPMFRERVGVEDKEFAVVISGNKGISRDGIHAPLRADDTITIVPMIGGSKSGGIFQTIIGIVLIVVGVVLSVLSGGTGSPLGAGLVKFGVVLVLSGVAQMLIGTPKAPKANTTEKASENAASDLYDGVVNTSAQGNPAPICLGGPILVGSYVVSAGYSTVQVPV